MTINWKIADHQDVVHLVMKVDALLIEYFRVRNYHRICYTGSVNTDAYVVYEPPAEHEKMILLACDTWFWMVPQDREKRPVTCLACLAS